MVDKKYLYMMWLLSTACGVSMIIDISAVFDTVELIANCFPWVELLRGTDFPRFKSDNLKTYLNWEGNGKVDQVIT